MVEKDKQVEMKTPAEILEELKSVADVKGCLGASLFASLLFL
jgi:hypothetical protein